MAKSWPALDIHVPSCDPQLQDLVLAELDDFQPTAVQEPPDQGPLRAFFTSPDNRDAAAHALLASFAGHLVVESVNVDDEDWAAKSQASLKAITVGRVTVAPPWEIGGEISVVIQPSMGFGTGHHATTRLMLKLLQTIDLHGKTVLDVGCGSGVLAIAGVLLGAREATAVDNDPDALESARENLALNQVDGRVTLTQTDLRELRTPADVVLANLTGALLERHADTLAALVAPGGTLIVSGFMDSEHGVVPALEKHLRTDVVEREDEWRAARFQKSFQAY